MQKNLTLNSSYNIAVDELSSYVLKSVINSIKLLKKKQITSKEYDKIVDSHLQQIHELKLLYGLSEEY